LIRARHPNTPTMTFKELNEFLNQAGEREMLGDKGSASGSPSSSLGTKSSRLVDFNATSQLI